MNKKGSSPALILIIIAILVLSAAAGSYYYLKAIGKFPGQADPLRGITTKTGSEQDSGTSPAPISDSDDPQTLETELNDTVIESPDKDLPSFDPYLNDLE